MHLASPVNSVPIGFSDSLYQMFRLLFLLLVISVLVCHSSPVQLHTSRYPCTHNSSWNGISYLSQTRIDTRMPYYVICAVGPVHFWEIVSAQSMMVCSADLIWLCTEMPKVAACGLATLPRRFSFGYRRISGDANQLYDAKIFCDHHTA